MLIAILSVHYILSTVDWDPAAVRDFEALSPWGGWRYIIFFKKKAEQTHLPLEAEAAAAAPPEP